jgi:hypothetical protein
MGRAVDAIYAFLLILLAACGGASRESPRPIAQSPTANPLAVATPQPAKRNSVKLIHVLVALCDNQYQGIVPVPARIGNGDDPVNNLYWGAAFGVKSFFKNSRDWKPVPSETKPRPEILERLVFKHQTKDVYLIADAYRGREIKRCVTDFFAFSAGAASETVSANSIELYAGAGAALRLFSTGW